MQILRDLCAGSCSLFAVLNNSRFCDVTKVAEVLSPSLPCLVWAHMCTLFMQKCIIQYKGTLNLCFQENRSLEFVYPILKMDFGLFHKVKIFRLFFF